MNANRDLEVPKDCQPPAEPGELFVLSPVPLCQVDRLLVSQNQMTDTALKLCIYIFIRQNVIC